MGRRRAAPQRGVPQFPRNRVSGHNRPLALAGRAEIGRALALDDLPDRGAAAPAGLARAFVDEEFLAEVARACRRRSRSRAAWCRPAGSPRRAPRGPPRPAARSFARLHPARGAARVDAGPEQRLARVDVADAHDDALVHQELLDRHLAALARLGREIVRVEVPSRAAPARGPRAADARPGRRSPRAGCRSGADR